MTAAPTSPAEQRSERSYATVSRARREFEPGPRGRRILHATEALAAGVGLSLARLAMLQAEAGIRPTVIGLRRYDTPDDAELRRWFGPDVELIVYPRAGGRVRQLCWLGRELARLLRSGRFEVLHLHSSFAGAIGRVLAAPFAGRVRTFYSPHGFAFLRQDLVAAQRRLILQAERMLALLPSRLVLVSPSEREVARRVSGRVALLENGVEIDRFEASSHRAERGRPVVAMIGRVTEQKAPWRFAAAAERFSDHADFRWLGYGPAEDVARWLGDSPVELSGRLDHAELLDALRDTDIVYFPTLWEGMPLSLIEAQASGLPVVASDIEGNRDVVIDDVTGFLRSDETELLDALGSLIHSHADRARMAGAAAAHAERFSDAGRGHASFAVYGIDPAAATSG